MNDPQLIWKLGRWIARREGGAARLSWSDGEAIVRIRDGRIRSIEGLDATEVSRRLECAPAECADLLEEAHAISHEQEIPETQAIGTAKEVLQEAVHQWLIDEDRELEVVEGVPNEGEGPGISITHAFVELVLSDLDHDAADHILPDRDVLLRRAQGFLELYAPLRLAEEADLIVAKISGERTAHEIASGSPHGEQEVLRLLAALVVTGMLEPVPVVTSVEQLEILPTDFPEDEPRQRRLPVAWIVAVAAVVLIALGYLGVRLRQSPTATPPEVATTSEDHHWALVVDMGCEPEELQRILRKARENPKTLQPIAADQETGEPCWRLAWGQFATVEDADQSKTKIPSSLLRDGFEPHPVKVPDEPAPFEPELPQD